VLSGAALIVAHDARSAWFVVAAYFIGAAAAAWAGSLPLTHRDRLFWFAAAVLLVLLGINKQLDLQTLVTVAGRDMAQREGWFENRRVVQEAFVLFLLAGAAIAGTALALWLRRSVRSVKLAAGGILLLFAFILLRAASFHHMDTWVTKNVAGLRSGWWLELAGIAVISLAALTYRRSRAV
jgi:hypothetical protein